MQVNIGDGRSTSGTPCLTRPLIVASPVWSSEFMEPRIRFKTTQNAHGSTATATLLFLTRVSYVSGQDAFKRGLTGDQTRTAMILEAVTRGTLRQWYLIEKLEDCKDNMKTFLQCLEEDLKQDSGLRLVGDWAQRCSDSNAVRLPELHSREFIKRLDVKEDIKVILSDKMWKWPLGNFFSHASGWANEYCTKASGSENATHDNADEPHSHILFKKPSDTMLKDFLNVKPDRRPPSQLKDFRWAQECVRNRNWTDIADFERHWKDRRLNQISIHGLTVTLSGRVQKGLSLHECSVCLPMMEPSVVSMSAFPDWDKLLVLIAKHWREELDNSREYQELVAQHGGVTWGISHHKRDILHVDGAPFVLASCNSDRMAVVARFKDKDSEVETEIVHMYYAMGLKYQHPKQFVILAVCRGLFVAKALVEAMRKQSWWMETLLVLSTGDPESDLALRNEWAAGNPNSWTDSADWALSGERWRELSRSFKSLKTKKTLALKDVLKCLECFSARPDWLDSSASHPG